MAVTSFDLQGNQLVALGGEKTNIWTLDGALNYPVGRFPVRMAVVKLTGTTTTTGHEKLLIWSPLPVSTEIVRQIEALGTVAYIVAPNSLHWLGVMPFAKACCNTADIQICVAPGLARKQEALDAGLKWNYVLNSEEDCPAEWKDEIHVKYVPGIPSLEEVILYHTSSQTLLVGDMAFHFQANDPKANGTGIVPWYLKCCDGYRPCCLTRTFGWIITDFDACHKAMEEILEQFDFDCIVLSHGAVVWTDAKMKLREGTVSLLKEWRDGSKQGGGYASKTTTLLVTAVAVSVGLAIYSGLGSALLQPRPGKSNSK